MAHAEGCPICGGRGKVMDEQTTGTTAPSEKTCYGCGGLGWVTVEDQNPPLYQFNKEGIIKKVP